MQSTKQLFSRQTTTTNVTTSKIKKNNFTFSSHDDEEQKKATYERLSARLPSILNEENTMGHTAWMRHLDWEDMLPRTPIDELLEMGYKITKDSPEWLQNSHYNTNKFHSKSRRKKKIYGYYTKEAQKKRKMEKIKKRQENDAPDDIMDDFHNHILKHFRDKEPITVEGDDDDTRNSYFKSFKDEILSGRSGVDNDDHEKNGNVVKNKNNKKVQSSTIDSSKMRGSTRNAKKGKKR